MGHRIRNINMAKLNFAFLATTQFLGLALSLQVSPNSKCASVCLDNPTHDVSDPNASTTKGTDVVCTDDSYSSSPIGQKFEKCVSCLQNSSSTATGENDQEWFLYNIRFAFNTCVYGTSVASENFSSPCSTDTVCGPLRTALETGMQPPALSTQYAYCEAKENAFVSTYHKDCGSCLRQNSDESYLSNFLVALSAGCSQRPEPGTLIGLDGSVFSKQEINVTSLVINPTKKTHEGLATGAIIGIAVGAVAICLVIIAGVFICSRKRKARRMNGRLKSGLDDRYGNTAITMPVHGAYNDPSSMDPHYPAEHEGLGLTKIPLAKVVPRIPSKVPLARVPPPRIQTSLTEDKFRSHEKYNKPGEDYYSHASPIDRHEDMARGLGFKTRDKTANQAEPSPSYSPPGSTQPTQTPISQTYSGTSSPVSPIRTRNQFARASISTTGSRTGASPITGPGLPKPSRQNSTNTSASAANAVRSNVRHTRDLSVSRGPGDDRYNERSPIQISGPIVAVGSRFDDEQELKKRRMRERMYREGFVAREEDAHERESSPEEEEMWPGNY